tara:strand:+ start:140 stop:511 length:372 start_codon:yes stop_codon:yes gene_type:complete
MNEKELRIGNWINVSGDLDELRVAPSDEQCNYHHIKDMATCNKEFTYLPIPLTEEWLLKFGFIAHTNRVWFRDGEFLGIDLGIEIYFVQQHTTCEGYLAFIRTPIKYVHQLQNLYFALTGKEL